MGFKPVMNLERYSWLIPTHLFFVNDCTTSKPPRLMQDIGGLDRSVYFGRLKDLYHMDHFAGHFLNVFPELLVSLAFCSLNCLSDHTCTSDEHACTGHCKL